MGEKGNDNSRVKWVGGGFVIGFLWGTVMWVIFGMPDGAKLWIYLALTGAMIGAGVAAIFGLRTARKRGERISPRMSLKGADEVKAEAKAAKKAARNAARNAARGGGE